MFHKFLTIIAAVCMLQTNLFAQDVKVQEGAKDLEPQTKNYLIDQAKKMPKRGGLLFPEWKRPGLGIILNLQGGQVQTSDFSGISIGDNAIYEANGIAGLRNLPIVPGNPGLYVSPQIAYGRGFRFTDSCLLYTSPSPQDKRQSRMPSSA